ncbi:glycosyltransferase family 2 protein [Bosea sp. MMO-172]|uniref:glycosyltransferase family 2 protein n=1 Tax=Bosea sp. MMO-172 TaxID=3127885 RepID=UPI00301A3E22
MTATPSNIVVGIATSGRREALRETLIQLDRQELRPQRILICPSADDDVDWEHAASLTIAAERIDGPRGLTAQRNAILDAAGDPDLIVFFDDDYLPADSFLAETERLFRQNPDIIAATGHVLADSVHGPGIELDEALAVLAGDRPPRETRIWPVENTYGCNMAFRMATIRQVGARFDEKLPLYGWQEDVDFCALLAASGRIVHATALRGVHRAVKRGRTSGVRFGYSQVANTVYLARKGTMRPARAWRLSAPPVIANVVCSLLPQSLIDRRGRLKGNLLALWDLARGRLDPQRILSLD